MLKKNELFFWVMCFFSLVVHAGEYASLKHNEVNMRAGPGERFPILWVYQEKNYPVEVLDSFEIWRQIRDKEGTVGWVHQNMLKKTRYAVVEKEGNLLKKNDSTSSSIAVVQPGVIARLEECPLGKYCKITVSDETHTKKGWFPRSALWGLDNGEIVEK